MEEVHRGRVLHAVSETSSYVQQLFIDVFRPFVSIRMVCHIHPMLQYYSVPEHAMSRVFNSLQAQIKQFLRLLYRRAFSVVKYIDALQIHEGQWLSEQQLSRMCKVRRRMS